MTNKKNKPILLIILTIMAITAVIYTTSSKKTNSTETDTTTNTVTNTTTGAIPKDNLGFTPQETYNLIASNEVVCIDVRTPMEYSSGHAEGCKLLPISENNFADEIKALDPSKTYIFICRTQNRATKAVAIARNLGFENAYLSSGGILNWKRSGLPVIKYK